MESDDPSRGNEEEIESKPQQRNPSNGEWWWLWKEFPNVAAEINNEFSGKEKSERVNPEAGTMISKMWLEM